MKQTGYVFVRIPTQETEITAAFEGMVANLPTQTAYGLTFAPQAADTSSGRLFILPINELECLGGLTRVTILVAPSEATMFIPTIYVELAILGADLGKLGFQNSVTSALQASLGV